MITKKKILEILNDKFFSNYNHGLFITIDYSKLINLINSIKVNDLGYDLIRIGPKGDGGYLIPDILDKIKTCFSPGIGQIHGFEKDLLQRGIRVYMADKTISKPNLPFDNYEFLKKNIGSHDDKETITLNTWIKNSQMEENLLLQMDIEGSEYEVIHNIDETNLKKFKVMIVEFHHFEQILTKIGYKVIKSTLDKILKYFDVAHIHPNNCCGSFKVKKTIIPSTLEITFLKKELTLHKKKTINHPHNLDSKNVEKNRDIFLDESWY